MLENNVRINFTDIFEPPEGYELEHVWGTSYSVSLEAYIMVLLAMDNYGNVPDGQNVTKLNKAQLLTIIERNCPKITLLAQQGLVYFNQKFSPSLQALLWQSIKPQIPKNNGSFHPKVWLVAFQEKAQQRKDGSEPYKFRLLVTSRNLTQDTDFDAAVVFESTSMPQGKQDAHERILGLLENEMSEEWKERVKQTQFDKGLKRFGVFNVTKLPEGVHTVISPFLDDEKVLELKKTGLKNIFSTKDAISKLQEATQEGLSFFVLREMNTSETADADAEPAEAQNDGEVLNKHYNLHAKLYFTDKALFLGSRNCTWRGWNSNTEFMVKLRNSMNEQDLLDSLIYDPNGRDQQKKNNKTALFQPCNIETLTKPERTDSDEGKTALVEFLKTIKAVAKFEDNRFTLTIAPLTEKAQEHLKRVQGKIRICPLFAFGEKDGQDAAMERVWGTEISWTNFQEKDISPYFVVVYNTDDRASWHTLFAEIVSTTQEDYADRFKNSWTANDLQEYICSQNEVPLTNLHFENADSGCSEDTGEYKRNNYGESRQILERIIRNLVASPDCRKLALKNCEYLKNLPESLQTDEKQRQRFSELKSFLAALATSKEEDEKNALS